MHNRVVLLASLVMALYGCGKPEVPKQYAFGADDWLLAKDTGCFMCHNTAKNLLGPAWENVSDRYKNDPDAEAHLMNKIRNGGNGAWSTRTMPGYDESLLTTPNRKRLVKFILALSQHQVQP